MKLIQHKSKIVKQRLLQNYFTFDSPAKTPIMVHSIHVNKSLVGYVATEDFGVAAAPHMFIHPKYREEFYMQNVAWLFTNVYCPLMKAIGKEFLATNCSQEDAGTTNFLERIGFSIKKIAIAEMKL